MTEAIAECALPGPTTDLGRARADLGETGCCLVADALDDRRGHGASPR